MKKFRNRRNNTIIASMRECLFKNKTIWIKELNGKVHYGRVKQIIPSFSIIMYMIDSKSKKRFSYEAIRGFGVVTKIQHVA
jgi:hypothetical protein